MHSRPAGSLAPWRLAALLPALCCLSCSAGASLHPVRGKVLLKGEPVEGAVVTFHPKGADLRTVLPVGQTDAEGTFTLSTGQSPGAPAGEYVVTLICPQMVDAKGKKQVGMSGQRLTTVDAFKGAYAREESSTIKVEVKSGANELEPFNLK
jgi:hypothetical protein